MVIRESAYAVGEIVGIPDRPDKTEQQREAERRADRMTHSQVLKRYRMTPEQFEIAQSKFSFPKAIARTVTRDGLGENVYSCRQLEAACAEVVAFVATLPKR